MGIEHVVGILTLYKLGCLRAPATGRPWPEKRPKSTEGEEEKDKEKKEEEEEEKMEENEKKEEEANAGSKNVL